MALLKVPTSRALWARHEHLVLEVFSLALKNLRRRHALPVREDDVSELVALEARNANFSLNQEERGLEYPPAWEKPRQPASEADIGHEATKKRPDFSSTFRDPAARSAEYCYLDYHVECKRLGEGPSENWNLNKNYVQRGIHRFLDAEYGYGQRARSGAMIGYVQSMGLEPILGEVKGYLNEYRRSNVEHGVGSISFQGDGFGTEGLARASQELVRAHVTPRRFDLRHLWVDLRPPPR